MEVNIDAEKHLIPVPIQIPISAIAHKNSTRIAFIISKEKYLSSLTEGVFDDISEILYHCIAFFRGYSLLDLSSFHVIICAVYRLSAYRHVY